MLAVQPEPSYVYRAFNADGRLLYVGSTKQLGERLRQHSGLAVWWAGAARFTFEGHDTLDAARFAERVAIRTEHPRFNIKDRAKDHPEGAWHYGMAAWTLRDRFPQDCREQRAA